MKGRSRHRERPFFCNFIICFPTAYYGNDCQVAQPSLAIK